jgi:hypothetical protein
MNAQVFIGRTIASSIFAASLVVMSGCMDPAQRHDEFTTDMQETLSVDEVLERQAMAGAAAMLVPKRSACTSMAASDCSDGLPVRCPRFRSASTREMPMRVSMWVMPSSCEISGCASEIS